MTTTHPTTVTGSDTPMGPSPRAEGPSSRDKGTCEVPFVTPSDTPNATSLLGKRTQRDTDANIPETTSTKRQRIETLTKQVKQNYQILNKKITSYQRDLRFLQKQLDRAKAKPSLLRTYKFVDSISPHYCQYVDDGADTFTQEDWDEGTGEILYEDFEETCKQIMDQMERFLNDKIKVQKKLGGWY